ncbi:ankyrin repeat domain-containing protein [Piscinibacter gummiphilus]|uniref:Ankyrin repeat domain-containing protein n=1 Tax=Piscinibacter gummiphilus TaxID=946333 RepID=A0ABZ0CPY1_9BURK|nr:ankyrin repeat domain-containing protein [Piscinibacter gummiphilus]WOB06893.1 ankyrin repeat domain-containing protein [Piscinibacter gummiphilus]
MSAFVAEAKRLSSFAELDFSDINATDLSGENLLHLAVAWENHSIAAELLKAGININQHGDLGHTPLHEACAKGDLEMVKLLVHAGADLFALTEGHPPFTSARYGGHDHICDYLSVEMKRAQEREQATYLRARIAQLRREIDRLEGQLGAARA